MLAIVSLLIIITMSMLVTKIASVALTHTGLSRQSARFQARSAFTGVGFTTSEAEGLVNHPVRRKVVMTLMLLGNAGIVSAVSSLMLTFVNTGEESVNLGVRFGALLFGVALLWIIATRHFVDRFLSRIISLALSKWSDLEVRDYESLLRVSGDYSIHELRVEAQDWMANKTLMDLALRDEGVMVLGIHQKDSSYLGAPKGTTKIQAGDLLLLYGRDGILSRLDQRKKNYLGDRDHEIAVKEQAEELARQEELEQSQTEKVGV